MDKNKNFQEKLDKIHKGKIKLIGNYIKNNIKTKVQCTVCNHKWSPLPMTLTRSNKPTGCPECNPVRNTKKTQEEFEKEVYDLVGDEYEVKGNYVNTDEKIEMLHHKCNKSYPVRPSDFIRGYRCPHCMHPSKKKTHDEFVKEVHDLTDGEYKVRSKYKGTGKYVNIEHIDCGHVFPVRPRNFLSNGSRCPICSSIQSKGTKYIDKFLDDEHLDYSKEVKFDNLKHKRKLRFDYNLENYDILLEFDGQQHFKEQSIWSDEFKATRLRDALKNKYIIDNKLTLLRLDDSNYKKLPDILKELEEGRSTTIERYNVYFIQDGELINDNNKYQVVTA